jgi:STE24 endopeptidase
MRRWFVALSLGLLLFCGLHVPPVAAGGARSWVDRRVDALSAEQLAARPPSALVDADRASVAERLAAVRRPLFFAWAFAQICVLFLAWRSGFAAMLRDALANRIANRALLRAGYGVLLVVGASLAGLPFSLFNRHLARLVGLTHEPLQAFLRDVAVATALEAAIAGIALAILLALLDRTRLWYLWAMGGALLFSLGALLLTPVVIEPLFLKVTPLDPHSALGRRLQAVERAAGGREVPIFTTNLSRTSEVGNANVEGIGPTRRVLIGDTLLKTATPAEVSFVMAHELGHVVRDDPLTLTLVAEVLSLLVIAAAMLTAEGIAVRGDDDPLSRLPLIAALAGLFGLMLFPLGNVFSQRVEARADRFGLAVTHDPVAAARLFVRFADEAFAPVCPPPWVRLYFYDHPPLGSRIAAATGRADPCK